MKVVYLKATNSKGYLKIGVEADNKTSAYYLSERVYHALSSPMRGDNLTRDTLSKIIDEDMRYRATRSALGSLSLCDSSKEALCSKLLKKGYNRKIAESVVNYMCSLGYIDEERQMEKLIVSFCENNNFGRQKIFAKLRAKGYPAGEISKKINSLLREGSIDFEKAKARLLGKYPPDLSSEEKRKILYKNGFTNV